MSYEPDTSHLSHEWLGIDQKAADEGEAEKRSFRSVTKVGERYKKPRGKNGRTPAARAKAEKKEAKLSKEAEALAREARLRKMINRILSSD